MSGVAMPGSLWVVLFAAACSFVFGFILAYIARKWEEKRHAIKTVEYFCDMLLQDSTCYWSEQVSHDNHEQMQAITYKMGAILLHLSAFVHNNFPKNAAASLAIREIDAKLTGGDFATVSRQPNAKKVQESALALVKLRFAVQKNNEKKKQ